MSNLPTVRQTSGLAIHAGPTVLGERSVRIPTSGKIRSGIMVLTKAGAAREGAQKAYDDGVARGLKWSDIEKAIRAACRMSDQDKSPLTPKNAPYFTVRPSDFTIPETAARILELYGEDRGEGRHLYRFPVVLPVDNWQAVLPHALKAYRRNELVYWSEYGPDGVRYCMQKQGLVKDERSNRHVRPFGGRPTVMRDVPGGRCDPENCPQYQAQPQQCKLSGSFIFYIPGIIGAGAFELPMTSFYGLQGIRQQLELMAYARGRISGTYNGQPMFYLLKRQEEVAMLDLESGEPKRVKQWIPTIEGAIDMTKMLTAPEADDEELPALGQAAVAVLEGPADGELLAAAGDDIAEAEFEEPPRASSLPSDDGGPSVKELQRSIKARAGVLDLPWDAYKAYATRKQGAGWEDDRKRLAAVLDELTSTTPATRAALLERIELDEDF